MRLFAHNLLVSIFFVLFIFLFSSKVIAAELQPGSVWQWSNATASATQKEGLSDIVSVSSGSNHSLALKKDGTVWAWGSNDYGQLGTGISIGNSMLPVQVKSSDGLDYLIDVKAIASGSNFSMVLKNDGTVWIWGNNNYGARGTGIGSGDSSSKILLPRQVKGVGNSGFLLQIIAIAAGGDHSLALKSDGNVVAWGMNDYGQSGPGSIYSSVISSPMKIMDGAISIAAGGSHSLAVKNDGAVWGWGRTYEGQLGIINGIYGVQSGPIQVPGISGIKNISSKSNFTVAMSQDGKVFEWGHGSSYYSGDRNPRQVQGLDNVREVVVGQWLSNGTVGIAIKNDGTVWQWDADNNNAVTQIRNLSNAGSVTVGIFTGSFASIYIPILTPTPTPTPTPAKTPLILIPGIGGSELKTNEAKVWAENDGHGGTFNYLYPKDETVWLNEDKAKALGEDDYFDVLRMKTDGMTSEANVGTNGNLVARAYQGAIDFFISNGYTLNKDLFVFPYDWRKDISLTVPLLDQKINEIKTQTGSQKVDIVAHSMGGLVARNYIADFSRAQNVRKLFTLGTPYLGSVDSLKNLRYGGCLTPLPVSLGPLCLGIIDSETNDVVQNMISGFELSPSQSYFNFYSGQDNRHPYPYKTETGSLNYSQIKTLLTGFGHNTSLFNPSEVFHSIDANLSNTNGVNITVIAGSGQSTLGQIIEEKRMSLLGIPYIHKDIVNINGDKTVPLFSASLNDSDRNLSLFDNTKVFYTNQDHGNLVSSGPALNLVKNILSNDSQLPDKVSKQPYHFGGTGLSVHSPVNIHVYDSSGNHTGPTSNGDFETNIPGSSYDTLGDAKFIFVPDSGNYNIKFEATDQGSFDFKIRKYENDTVSQETLYKDIPLTRVTKAETQFDTSSAQSPVIHLDENGNGSIQDINASANLAGNAVFDQTPPVTGIQLSGVLGNSGWYKSDVVVTLNPQDEGSGSGILKTEYSLDNGITTNIYTGPFTISTEKINKLKFRSIDNAGNEEDPQEAEIKIDKTTPEAKIFVDPDQQNLIVAGLDANPTTVVRSDNKLTKKKDDAFYVITDEAGNSLKLDVRERDKEKQDRFRIYSVQYNSDPIKVLASNYFNVTYNGKKQRANIKEQNFELKGEVKIRIQYDTKKNKSTIIVKEPREEKVKEVRNGLVYLNLLTDRGQLKTSY